MADVAADINAEVASDGAEYEGNLACVPPQCADDASRNDS